jgi:hypothetical protein
MNFWKKICSKIIRTKFVWMGLQNPKGTHQMWQKCMNFQWVSVKSARNKYKHGCNTGMLGSRWHFALSIRTKMYELAKKSHSLVPPPNVWISPESGIIHYPPLQGVFWVLQWVCECNSQSRRCSKCRLIGQWAHSHKCKNPGETYKKRTKETQTTCTKIRSCIHKNYQ